MTKFEEAALGQYLSEWPTSKTFEEVLEGLGDPYDESGVLVWEPFEGYTAAWLHDQIVNTRDNFLADPGTNDAKPLLYLHLYWGRTTPDEVLGDREGHSGPSFQATLVDLNHNPLANGIRVCGPSVKEHEDEFWLKYTNSEFIYYDGYYYGHWSVSPKPHSPVTLYDPAKAVVPYLKS